MIISERLYEVNFPAHLFVYGPSKNTITMYNRSEYGEVFGESWCQTEDEANDFINSLGYQGREEDLKIWAINTVVKEI